MRILCVSVALVIHNWANIADSQREAPFSSAAARRSGTHQPHVVAGQSGATVSCLQLPSCDAQQPGRHPPRWVMWPTRLARCCVRSWRTPATRSRSALSLPLCSRIWGGRFSPTVRSGACADLRAQQGEATMRLGHLTLLRQHEAWKVGSAVRRV